MHQHSYPESGVPGGRAHAASPGERIERNRADYCSAANAQEGLQRQVAQLEDELFQQRHWMSEMHGFLNIAPEAIFFKNASLRYTRVNCAAARLLGLYNTRQAVGRTNSDFLTPQCDLLIRSEEIRMLRTGLPKVGEGREWCFLDGRRRWMRETKIPLYGLDGRLEGIAITCVDVTDAAQEEALAVRLEKLSNELREMQANSHASSAAAHDITNYLIAVRISAERIQQMLAQDHPAQALLSHIDRAALHSAELARNLAPAPRTFTPAPFCLAAVTGDLLELLSATLPRTVTLRYRSESGLPNMLGEPFQVRQAVMNLVLNAAQALAPHPGSIDIHIGLMHCEEAYLQDAFGCDAAAPGAYLFVNIQDDGCGIQPAQLRQIFTPFYTTKSNGQGLGLATVASILHRHRGKIRVSSEPGAGACFRLLFPAGGR